MVTTSKLKFIEHRGENLNPEDPLTLYSDSLSNEWCLHQAFTSKRSYIFSAALNVLLQESIKDYDGNQRCLRGVGLHSFFFVVVLFSRHFLRRVNE